MPPKKKSKVNSKASSSREEEAVPSGDSDQETGTSKRKKQKPKAADGSEKVLQNKTNTDFHNQDFTNGSTTVDGKSWNLKIASWNGIYIKFFKTCVNSYYTMLYFLLVLIEVDGIRAWVKVIFICVHLKLKKKSLIFVFFTERRSGLLEP